MNMKTGKKFRWMAIALSALGASLAVPAALAAGTASSTAINNRATVNYSVGGVAQGAIESSPTGNSTATGSDTTFVVDNKILHTVNEFSGNATIAGPGAANQVAAYTVTNTGNTAQGYLLAATNETGSVVFGQADNTNVNNLRVFVDANGNGAYDAGTDIATNIATLAPDASVRVFVLADLPLTVTNGQYANVQLAAQATTDGTTTVAVESGGADDPAAVDIVFADGGAAARDGIHEAADQYAVQSAALSVAKSSSVVSDPFNGTSNPKSIPGAVVEYEVTVSNTGSVAASLVQIADPLPANTTFVQGGYPGGSDIELQVGAAAPSYCVAETPADTNADGCYIDGSGGIFVGPPSSIGTVNPGIANAVVVRFQVTIN
jgi:uncharacterized repeat protein (TIGR01451 family)